mgnify:CR=1 FL=1|jgi:uncharacterized membrane protein YdjX (TVP38/TMEM64 family)
MIYLKREIKKHIISVLTVIVILVILVVQLEKINDWFFVQGPAELKNLFGDLGYLSPIVFILIYITANIFLVPSYPFVFTSGIVFGLVWGTILSLIAEVLSATVNFVIGREVTYKHFMHKIKNKKVLFIKLYIEKHGFGLILIVRYLGFYFDVISYAAGMTRLKYRDFIIATFIGFIPYIMIYVYAGYTLMNIKSSSFVYSILIFKLMLFGVFIIGYFLYKFIKKRKLANEK